MFSRVALAAGAVAAGLTLALALAVSGFAPESATPASFTTNTDTVVDPAADPSVQVDTIYLAPPAEPETITINQASGDDDDHDDEHDDDHDDHDDHDDEEDDHGDDD